MPQIHGDFTEPKDPWACVSVFILGAIKRGGEVPCIAALNDLAAVLDRGPGLAVIKDLINHQVYHPRLRRETVKFKCGIPRYVEFIQHDPGRQMIGSFNPVSRDFFEDAYRPFNTRPAAAQT